LTLSSAEVIAILDADFCPRPDFLRHLVPYLASPEVGIVQSPQCFDTAASMGWIERAAGAAQESFFRWIQPSRDASDAAICCGSNAIYRRAAPPPAERRVRGAQRPECSRAAGRHPGQFQERPEAHRSRIRRPSVPTRTARNRPTVYPWYLWHWPVLVFATAHYGNLSWPVQAACVLASAAPAYLTLVFIERPLRRSTIVTELPRRGLSVGAAAVVLALTAGLLVGSLALRQLGTSAPVDLAGLPPDAVTGTQLLQSANTAMWRRRPTPPATSASTEPATWSSFPCSATENGPPAA
jgi:hypothetical protein